ncbi:MAG: DNA topoisomerase [Rikenellaceae bacterium]
MRKLIIAEKPSVAREIAQIVGAYNNEQGYIHGNGYTVTWALGHLVTLAMPDSYGAVGFNRERLPIIPTTFKLAIRQIKGKNGYQSDPAATKQLAIIKALFDRCDSIIVATDAGREGELIFRYIYNYLGCNKPFERLWISSLTERAIREGLDNLKDGSEFDNLYLSAKARSEADWLIGINATQAITIAASEGTYSLGRVQSPTLMMIYNRYTDNKAFKSKLYWRVNTEVWVDGRKVTLLADEKYESEDAAKSAVANIGNSVNIKSIESKETVEQPPLLHDLTSLQKEMNKRYGFSADQTLVIAQKLYESKIITYPRTGSCYIPEDVAETLEDLLHDLQIIVTHNNTPYELAQNPRCVNDSKVTDHHALLLNEGFNFDDLTQEESLVAFSIGQRMVEAFSPSCIKEITTIKATAGDIELQSTHTRVKQLGWRAISGVEDDEFGIDNLTPYIDDDLPIVATNILKKATTPKPLHTEATLLAAMESAGRDLEDEAERMAIRDSGIGTPATRAAIIETLFNRDYIRREGRNLVPTEKGEAVCKVIKDKQIGDAQMTGMWEAALLTIERGELSCEEFSEGIRVLTQQITRELLSSEIKHRSNSNLICPKCGKSKMQIYEKVAKCRDKECAYTIFRNKSGKQLTERDITDLIESGETKLIKGFVSKAGKNFCAKLRLDKSLNVEFDFADQKR